MFIVTIMVLLHKQRNLDRISDPNTFLGIIISFEISLRESDVKICRVPTDDNVADPLTKPLPQAKHDRHARFIGIRYIDEWA